MKYRPILTTLMVAGLLSGAVGTAGGAAPRRARAAAYATPSAALAYGWGAPKWSDEFTGSRLDLGDDSDPGWAVYNSPGHAGNGLRRPSQVTLAGGVMTQTGTADALSAGMLFKGHDERRGRWEFRMRSDQATTSGQPYHQVVALLPTGVPYNSGERDIDVAEAQVNDPGAWLFVHHPPFRQAYTQATVNLSRWHTYAVEIANNHLTWFIDGVPKATIRNTAALPTTPMALNVQLDPFVPRGLNPARLQLDWMRFYPLPAGTVPTPNAPEPPDGAYNP
jgi:hypothetical protein